MKILILGAGGMLGHRLFIELSKHHEVHGTYTGWKQFLPGDRVTPLGMFKDNWRTRLTSVLQDTTPDVVINCIAKIHPADNRFDKIECIQINAELPHELMYLTHEYNARLIHFSTDGVFSGKRGNYTEDDTPDATDTYGTTKRLGEISDMEHVLTLRCCPIGRELPLSAKHSLVEWFLAQTGDVKGYTKAFFSPLSSHKIAQFLIGGILPNPNLHGMYHLSFGDYVSKYNLLCGLKECFNHPVEIIPDDSLSINRVLKSNRLIANLSGHYDDYITMLEEMAADNALYEGVHAH